MSADGVQHAVRESGETLTRGSERSAAGALMLAVAEVSLGGDEAAARVLADGVLAVIGHIDITSQG